MRDLVRLARTAGEVALRKRSVDISLDIVKGAVREERQGYTIEDYQFPELDAVRKTGQLTTKSFDSVRHGKVVICDELLHNKLILGYQDPEHERWFDINPIISTDLERWRSINSER